MSISVIDIRAFFGGASIRQPTLLDIFRAGKFDLHHCTNQQLRDIWCLARGQPTGRKGSPGLGNKRELTAWCLDNVGVRHLYPGF